MSSKAPKKAPYKLKFSHVENLEMGTQSVFLSRAKFARSRLCQFLKENDSSGKLTVTYYEDYRNVADFKNYKELNSFLDAFLEKELLDEFTKSQEG